MEIVAIAGALYFMVGVGLLTYSILALSVEGKKNSTMWYFGSIITSIVAITLGLIQITIADKAFKERVMISQPEQEAVELLTSRGYKVIKEY